MLPEEIKNKYFKKYVIYAFGAVGVLCIVVLLIQYINIGMLNNQIKRIKQENYQYNAVAQEIEELNERNAKHMEFIKLYDNASFPFPQFMHDLESFRPDSVVIISVDTPDRLIADKEIEGNKDDNENAEEKADENKKTEKEKNDENENTEKEKKPEEAENTKSGDESNQQIIIRGFGKQQEDISNYIYKLSTLKYIKNARNKEA